MHRVQAATPSRNRFRLIVLITICLTFPFALAGCIGGGGSGGSGTGGGDNEAFRTGSGSVSLSWVAPSEREDGTAIALSDLDGYEIGFGTESGRYTASETVSDPTATELSINNLASGTYYFAIRVRDSEGRQSRYSNEQRFEVN